MQKGAHAGRRDVYEQAAALRGLTESEIIQTAGHVNVWSLKHPHTDRVVFLLFFFFSSFFEHHTQQSGD